MQEAAVFGTTGLHHGARLPLRYESGSLVYSVTKDKTGLEYSVSSAHGSLAVKPILVVGAGVMGQTLLYEHEHQWYQSRLSYFPGVSELAATPGLSLKQGTDLSAALGDKLTASEVQGCLGCHTVHANTFSGIGPASAEPGIGCEGCHGPGRAHIQQEQVNRRSASARSAIFNPSALTASQSIDFCGSCHRSTVDIHQPGVMMPMPGRVRVQPYRLQKSKCWLATQDARLECVACHDPHQPLERNLASYDKRCLTCHSADATQISAKQNHVVAICPKATAGCVTCHMQQVTVPEMHAEFTDHLIRISRPNDPIPE